jgi:hypothetical protein
MYKYYDNTTRDFIETTEVLKVLKILKNNYDEGGLYAKKNKSNSSKKESTR